MQGTVGDSLGRFKRALTDEMEQELAQHCRDLDLRFYGITRKQIMKVAFEYAQMNGVSDRFNKEKQAAGKDWLKAFCRRHKLSVRVPEQCSMARAMGFNKVQVKRFYDNLKDLCLEKKFPTHRKFNMDETGLSTVPNKTPKVLTPTGKKTVCKISSADKGETVTAVCCMSATGIYVPPALIFPRKRMNPHLFKDAPPGTLNLVTETGYMNTDLFLDWLKHFVQHTKPSKDDPVLLIADNHTSHCSLPAIVYCRENHVTFLTLPPHASHVIQPLDKGFFAPLKTAYAAEAEKWLVQHPGQVIKLTDIAGIFKAAYSVTAKMSLAEKAFKVTGIEPYDPDVIKEELYAPSLVTDQPEVLAQPAQPAEQPADVLSEHQEELDEERVDEPDCVQDLPNEQPNQVQTQFLDQSTDLPGEQKSNDDLQTPVIQNPNVGNTLDLPRVNLAKIKKEKPSVSITSILPLPKVIIKEEKKAKRPSQKSEVITSSPFKAMLEEKEKEKKEKEKLKAKKMAERELKRKAKENDKNKKQTKKKAKTNAKVTLPYDVTQPSTSSAQIPQISPEDDKSVSCPGCGESYSENWIQCGICKEWWHEDCSAYEGSGPFVCDHC